MGTEDPDVPLRSHVPSSATGCWVDRYGNVDRKDWADADNLGGCRRGANPCSRLEESHWCRRGSRSCRSYGLKEVGNEAAMYPERHTALIMKTAYQRICKANSTKDMAGMIKGRASYHKDHTSSNVCNGNIRTDSEPYYLEQRNDVSNDNTATRGSAFRWHVKCID